MKVSICIPVYNGAEYIGKTMQSVLNQRYKDYELLIADNKSTDHTVEEVRKFADSRIRLVQNDRNYGMAGNWNICLQEARGKYIHFLCADDFLEPDCIARKVSILEKHPDVVLAFSASRVVDAQGKTVIKRRPFHRNLICDGCRMAAKSFRSGNLYGEPSNVLFRRKTAEKLGGFTAGLCYSLDWDYWLRLSMEGKTAYIDEYLMNFRISAASATSSLLKQAKELRKDDKLLVKRVRQDLGLSVTGTDLLLHYIAVNARLCAKAVFCLGVNKGDVI